MVTGLRERLQRDIQIWDSEPEHRTGTAGDQRTSEAIAQHIRDAGVEPIVQDFAFQRRIPQDCHVRIVNRRVDGIPCFDCLGTPKEGISGSLGKLTHDASIGFHDFDSGVPGASTQLLDRARSETLHLGIVVASAGPENGIALINADHFHTPAGPPVLQVARQHASWLQKAADEHRPASLTVTFAEEACRASNVGTTIEGTNPQARPLVVMTPKSSWWTSTAERGGGLTIWLECIRHFRAHRPARTLLFTANTGHELGHVGLDRYIDRHPELVKSAYCWLHLGANFAARGSAIRMQVANDELQQLGVRAMANQKLQLAGVTPPTARPGGEARNIFDGGGAYISFLGSNHLFHHPTDRLANNVDLDRVAAMRHAVIEIATELARV